MAEGGRGVWGRGGGEGRVRTEVLDLGLGSDTGVRVQYRWRNHKAPEIVVASVKRTALQ